MVEAFLVNKMPLHLLIILFYVLQRHNTISQTLNQGNWEMESKIGDEVDFTCQGEQLQRPYYFFWYQQKPGRHPVYIRQISYLGDEHPNDAFMDVSRFALRHSKRYSESAEFTTATATLTNKRGALSDSAAYFCAINHMSEKYLKFGDGNRLRLLSEKNGNATAYLQNTNADGPTACMVRDSSPAVTSVMLSSETVTAEPTVITGESSYGLVAITSHNASYCQVKQGKTDIFANEDDNQCLTKTDEKMNFLQLTLLGVRLLCMKMFALCGLLTIDALTYSA